MCFTVCFGLLLSHQRTTSKGANHALVLVIRWTVCSLPISKERCTLWGQITSSYLRNSDSRIAHGCDLSKGSCNWYLWMQSNYQPVTFLMLILFSIKVRVCFLQQPELRTAQEKGSLQKGEKKPASKQDFYLGPQKIAQPGCYYTQGILRQLGLIIGNRALAINFGESTIKH